MKRSLCFMILFTCLASCAPRHATSSSFSSEPILGATYERRGPIGEAEEARPTEIVVLGTGTPIPDHRRAGSSLALIHKGQAYLFDIGAGATANAVKARHKYDLPALYPTAIRGVFLTHLHSDHFMDYAELANTFWWLRKKRLKAWGPVGLKAINSGMYAMMASDIKLRQDHGIQPLKNPDFYKVDATEIHDGYVYRDGDLTIEAFAAKHGEIRPSFSYKITTPGFTAVISGDTSYSEILEEKVRGVDLLFHEAISSAALKTLPETWQTYHGKSHTTGPVLGRLADRAKPKKLIIYHGIYYGRPERELLAEVKTNFSGNVVIADDLDRFRAEE